MANKSEMSAKVFKELFEEAVNTYHSFVKQKNMKLKKKLLEMYDDPQEALAQYQYEKKVPDPTEVANATKFWFTKHGWNFTEDEYEQWMRRVGLATRGKAPGKEMKKDERGRWYTEKHSDADAMGEWLGKFGTYDKEPGFDGQPKAVPMIKLADGREIPQYALLRRVPRDEKLHPTTYLLERNASNPNKPITYIWDTINPHANTDEWKGMKYKDQKEAKENNPWKYYSKGANKLGVISGFGLGGEGDDEQAFINAIVDANPGVKNRLFPHVDPEDVQNRKMLFSMAGKKLDDVVRDNNYDRDKVLWFIYDNGGAVRKDGMIIAAGAAGTLKPEDRLEAPERTPVEIDYNGKKIQTSQEMLDKGKEVTQDKIDEAAKNSKSKVASTQHLTGKGGLDVTKTYDKDGNLISSRTKGDISKKAKEAKAKKEAEQAAADEALKNDRKEAVVVSKNKTITGSNGSTKKVKVIKPDQSYSKGTRDTSGPTPGELAQEDMAKKAEEEKNNPQISNDPDEVDSIAVKTGNKPGESGQPDLSSLDKSLYKRYGENAVPRKEIQKQDDKKKVDKVAEIIATMTPNQLEQIKAMFANKE